MDELLQEFLTETNESLDVVDVELVRFEQDPQDAKILDNIFRLVHTVKGTCGFLGLPRLEALAHAAETLMGLYRDGAPVTEDGVSIILTSIDRLKAILAELEANNGQEPDGSDDDLIDILHAISTGSAAGGESAEAPAAASEDEPPLVVQELERELKPGEVSLDDLERAFQETEVEVEVADASAEEKSAEEEKPAEAKAPEGELVGAKAVQSAVKAAMSGGSGANEQEVQKQVTSQSIRVNVDTLENLMTMVSELVLTRNQLLEIVRRHEESEFKVPLQRLSNVTGELQDGVMQTRMQPIGNAWQKLPRIVRDLAHELEKDINLEMVGADTELDRQVLEMIKDPLTHMVRNSADHGLETTADRRIAGKPEKGTICLSAYHEGGHIIIEIKDDGRGLNTDKIKRKVIDNGIATEAELASMSENQIHRYIFAAGFSTAAEVTSVSGRGVGMDVVRNNIDVIGGTIDLKSIENVGTTFTIKIPLTLAIVSALIVESAGDRFAIPQLSVMELVQAETNSEHKIERIKNTPVLRLRNKLLPLVHLGTILGIESNDQEKEVSEDSGFIVVMQVGSHSFGVVVDQVFHTEEIVVKPMSSALRNIQMFSGNTILGDGAVIMIIDPNGVVQGIGSELIDSLEAQQEGAEEIVGNAQELTSMLLFRAGGSEPKAVPLSLVTRLEEVTIDQIENSNGRHLVQYRGALVPLVYVNDKVEIKQEGAQPMLVFSDAGRTMGLMVDEIVDIVEERLNIEVVSGVDGVIGSAVIKEKATEILDIAHYLPMAFENWFESGNANQEQVERRVLLVDNSPFFRNMLTPVLQATNYRVTSVASGEEALELLKNNHRFDVIVTELDMNGMSGFELAHEVRDNQQYGSPFMVAISTVCTPEAIEQCRRANFTDFVAKFDRPGLISALRELTVEMEIAA